MNTMKRVLLIAAAIMVLGPSLAMASSHREVPTGPIKPSGTSTTKPGSGVTVLRHGAKLPK
jgi:hypothetical protein